MHSAVSRYEHMAEFIFVSNKNSERIKISYSIWAANKTPCRIKCLDIYNKTRNK